MLELTNKYTLQLIFIILIYSDSVHACPIKNCNIKKIVIKIGFLTRKKVKENLMLLDSLRPVSVEKLNYCHTHDRGDVQVRALPILHCAYNKICMMLLLWEKKMIMFLKQSIHHKFRKIRMYLYYVCNMSINSSFHNNIYNFKVIMILPYICIYIVYMC